MNPSRIFILRPVATTLLMVGVVLAGAAAYRQLPISALPEVDYPTIQVTTFYPGASPDVMASSVTAPLERQFGQVPGTAADDLHQLRRQLGDHAAVQPQPQHRRRRTGGAAVDQRVRNVSPRGPADAADLQQDQPGRYAHPDSGAHVDGPCRCRRSKTSPTRVWRRKSRSCPVSDWSASAAVRKPAVRIQANPTSTGDRTGSTWRTCAARSSPPTSIRRRGTSMGRVRPTKSTPTISCCRAATMRRSSSPIAMARRSR